MSNSLQPHRLQPTRPLHPLDPPGKNTGVGCCFLLQKELWKESDGAQSCPTLCDPIDDSAPGSPVPGFLQARTLEWVAIVFSNAWKWKVKVKSPSRIWLLAAPWTVAYQAPPSMGFPRQEYWSGVPLPSPESLLGRPKKSHVEYEILTMQTIPLTLSDYTWSLGLSGMLGFFQAWGTRPAFWPQHSWDGSLVLASKFSVRQKNKGKKKILAHISLQFHVLSTTHPSTPTPY